MHARARAEERERESWDAGGILSAARDRVIRRRPVLEFDSIGAAIGYLRKAIDSEVADRSREIDQRLETHDRQTLEVLATHLRSASSPEAVAIGNEELRKRERLVRDCRVAIDRLSPKLRAVVELRWLSGVRPKFREIGEQLDISENAARKRHQRALGKLRAFLGSS